MLIIEVVFNPNENIKLLSSDRLKKINGLQVLPVNQLLLKIDQKEDESIIFQKLNNLIEIIYDLKHQLQELNSTVRIVHKIVSQYIEKEFSDKSIQNRTFIETFKGNDFEANFQNSNIDSKVTTLISKVNTIKYQNFLLKKLDKINSSDQFKIKIKLVFETKRESINDKNVIILNLEMKNHYL